MRFISGDRRGMYLLSISPARNAPRMPSSPANPDSAALMKSMASTKINCITESLYRRRKLRVSLGITMLINRQSATVLAANRAQNPMPLSPWCMPTMAASAMSAMKSDSIDDPTLSATLGLRCRP